jgi:hypothetical protein
MQNNKASFQDTVSCEQLKPDIEVLHSPQQHSHQYSHYPAIVAIPEHLQGTAISHLQDTAAAHLEDIATAVTTFNA